MSAPTGVEVTFPVEGAPTGTNCRGVEFGVTEVNWRTYVYSGRAWITLTAFGLEADGTSSNCTFYPDDDAPPGWVPWPPEWFFDVARDMRAAVHDPTDDEQGPLEQGWAQTRRDVMANPALAKEWD